MDTQKKLTGKILMGWHKLFYKWYTVRHNKTLFLMKPKNTKTPITWILDIDER